MKSSKPPALATWLMEHLLPRGKSEVLVGDLLEQFNQGRSAAWYWNQVLVSVLMILTKRFNVLWAAVGFTAIWISIFAVSYRWLLFVSHSLPFETVFAWGINLAWPISELFFLMWFTVLNALPVLLSLAIYLACLKELSLRRLLRGLLMGLIVSPLGYATGMLVRHLFTSWRGASGGYLILSLPVFVSLVVSFWAVQSTTNEIADRSLCA